MRDPIVLLLALAGCSGSTADGIAAHADASSDVSAADATASDVSVSDVTARVDAPTIEASMPDVASSPDAPSDASEVPAPRPPPGAHRCGQGEVTPSDASAACMAQSLFIDSPPPGSPRPVRRCDVATLQGGRWEAWCGGGMVYVWAVLRDLRATGVPAGCATLPEFTLSLGFFEHGTSPGGGVGGTSLLMSTPSSSFSTTATTSVTMEATFNATVAGVGRFIVVAVDGGLCLGRPPMPGENPLLVVSGANYRWDPAATL